MRRPGFLIAALVVLAAFLPAPASAHPASWHFNQSRWPTSASINYGLNAGFPSGEARDRVYDAKNKWNAVAGTAEPGIWWTMADDVNYGVFNNACSLNVANNSAVVFFSDLNGYGSTVVGYTFWCKNGSNVRLKSSVVADSTRSDWYTGNGDAPAGKVDMYSVLVHEWGHSNGFANHLAEGEPNVCPAWENVVRNAMCPSIFPGYEVQRTLKTHDIHTFQAAY